jgi:rhomboid protease GluP
VVVTTAATRPVVTYGLLGITIVVFILQFGSENLLGVDLPAVYGMKVNELIVQGQFWRLITPMFLHGSILHIAFNMYALFAFGPTLERFYGHGRYLGLYLVSGYAGNVISFMFTESPSLGSSTAIFGLLGAQGVLLYQNRAIFGSVAQRALGQLVMIGAINLFIGLTNPGIDNWGHLGGLVGGTLFAWFGGPQLRWEGIYPAVSLKDDHDTKDAVIAALIIAALFTLLATVTIFLWG